MTKLEMMFMPKSKLLERIQQLEKDIASLQHCHKQTIQEKKTLEARITDLEKTITGLILNYDEVTKKINEIFGVEQISAENKNKADKDRQDFSEAVAEVFDWS